MVSSVSGPQSVDQIWGQSGLVGAAKNAASAAAKAGASFTSAISNASNGAQGGGSVFQSFSSDLQALLVQQQNVSQAPQPGATADPSTPNSFAQMSQALSQSMNLFGGSSASASSMTNQVTQSALQSLQTLG